MKIKFTLPFFLIFLQQLVLAQSITPVMQNGLCSDFDAVNPNNPNVQVKKGGGPATTFDGNESINTTYTVSACGLNYISANFNLHQRNFGGTIGTGAAQPAPFVVSGMPACGRVYKAFLYTACESNGAIPISASITNPSGGNSLFPMTTIGTGTSICWNYGNTFAYRADITSIISGNGTYYLSGIPVFPSANDVDGATLFIIYTDETQAYTGSIVIADGMFTNVGPNNSAGASIQTSYSGFNVCGPTMLTQNFLVIADLQAGADQEVGLNSAVSNYTIPQASQVPWMLISQPGVPAVAGQTTSDIFADNLGGDCFGVVMAGMYYRTNCMSCTGQLTLTATTPTCSSTGAATVNITGGLAPFTYTWTGSAQTTSAVTNLGVGSHTVTVSDSASCLTKTLAFTVTRPSTITPAINNPTICSGSSTTLSASPLTSYTWSPGASLNVTNTASVIASPAVTTIYTLAATNSLNCVGTSTALVVVNPSPTVTANNIAVCIGYSNTLTAVGATNSYTWSPATALSATNAASVVTTPTSSIVYTIATTNSLNCSSSSTVAVTLVYTQTVSVANATACVGDTLHLKANTTYTGSSYVWSGPVVVPVTPTPSNPALPNANTGMNGNYSVTVVSAPGCTSNAVAGVTVFPLPTATISSNAPICAGENLVLIGTGSSNSVSAEWLAPTFNTNWPTYTLISAGTVDSGNYTLTITDNQGCKGFAVAPLLVKPLPVPTISYNYPLCTGTTLSLTAGGGTSYTWTGPPTFTSAVQNPTVGNVTAANAGTYNVLVSLNSCTATTNTVVVVSPLPVPTATNTGPVCETKSVQLQGGGGGTYNWSGPAVFTFSLQNPVIDSTKLVNNGIYTVTVTDALGCKASATTTLVVMAHPVIAASAPTVCIGLPGTLTVTAGYTYTWTGPSAFTSSLSTPTVTSVVPATSGNYSVIATAANTCTWAASATLSFFPLPPVTSTSASICFGSTGTLTAGGASTYTWAGPNSYTATGASVVISPVNLVTKGIYTVTGQDGNTCINTYTTTLDTLTLPTVTATGITVCYKYPATLTGNGGFLASSNPYLWLGPGSYQSATQNAAIASANSVASLVYTLVVTAPNNCTNSDTALLATTPLPVLATSGNSVICDKYPYTINVNGASTYTWSGPSGYSANGASAFIPVVTGPNTGSYNVVGTAAVSGCTNLATVVLSTMALPPTTASVAPVCFGSPTTLKANGAISYTWTGPPGSGFSSTSQNAVIPAVNNITAGNYTVVGTAANTCTAPAVTTAIFYNLPVPTYSAPNRVCFKSTMTLQGFGAKTYTWTGPYNYYSPNKNVTIPIFNMQQAGTYTLSVIDSLGCANDTSVLIKIDPLPTGKLLSSNKSTCVPFCSSYTLSNTGTNPIVNSSWLINNTVFPGDTFKYCVSKVTDNFVVGSFTDAIGCSNTVTFALNAYPKPEADYVYTPDKPLENFDEVFFHNASKGDKQVSWDWYFISNKGYFSSQQNPSYMFSDAGTYLVAMVVTNTWGCADTIIKKIVIDSDLKLYVPNAFTPNGDGLNDIFQPKGRGLQKYTMAVFDRWANKVFETNDFSVGWDGSLRGNSCTDDVYVWKINAITSSGQVKEWSGHVTLSR